MAKISRQHIFHAASASILAAALALPTSLTIAAADSRIPNGRHDGASAQRTDPPPSPPPTPSEPKKPTTPPFSPPDSAPSSDPTKPSTSSSPTSPGTSDSTGPTDPGDTDGQKTEPPPEQKEDIDQATTALTEEKERVPEELTSTVETLITIIDMVEDPRTSPQDRQGVTESAKNLSTALAAIIDPKTPPGLRKELTGIVKQVTATLKVVSGPRVPTEERSLLILVVARTTSTLDMICDPGTPRTLRDRMIAIVKDTTDAVENGRSGPQDSSADESRNAPVVKSSRQTAFNTLLPVSSSSDIMHDHRTPPADREQLAKITQEVSALLKKISDPRTSDTERSEATKELAEKSTRMKEQQEQAATAQERPEESLGRAAALCTSAIFKSTPESALRSGLKKLVPARWKDEGIKDFWKAKASEKGNDTLNVLAQLRNNEQAQGPFEVIPLVTELADLVPHDRLFGSLGASALYCEQTATYLDEEFGVTAGTWLTESSE
ncbi:hypothetical protein ABZ454_37965 [Streptomyces sp. NPDC005803]|uniref:hypothetical protein n=1 Tax=Streptomyces sp. NPDC005803 TaxID=3154297 RepID=UPI0033D33C6A